MLSVGRSAYPQERWMSATRTPARLAARVAAQAPRRARGARAAGLQCCATHAPPSLRMLTQQQIVFLMAPAR